MIMEEEISGYHLLLRGSVAEADLLHEPRTKVDRTHATEIERMIAHRQGMRRRQLSHALSLSPIATA
jgi:hypothetical protein